MPAVALPRIGFQVWGQHAGWPDLEAAVRAIEALGFDSVWSNDHFFPAAGATAAREDAPPGPFLEGWITLAGFAAATTRIRLGILVSAAGYRNVGLVVKQATAVDHLSAGRVTLGLGAGWHPRDHAAFGFELLPVAERLDRLEEQASAARRLLDGETVTVVGRHVRLDRAVNLPGSVSAHLPLLVAGGGERRTLRIAARYADAWNGEGDVGTWRHKSEVLDRHCAEVGRDPSAIRRTVGLPPASIRDTREDAVQALAARLEANGVPPAEAAGMAEDSPLAGTEAQVREVLAAYASAGADEAILDWPGRSDEETLERLAAARG